MTLHHRRQLKLVTIDYFSGFITCDGIPRETTEAVTKALADNFSKLGLPEQLISDNGPCFRSGFREFCEQLDIKHRTVSPHFHQSNGRVERAIQTVKQMLKKAKNNTELAIAMTTYLDTPVSEMLPSPAELFFGRRINT